MEKFIKLEFLIITLPNDPKRTALWKISMLSKHRMFLTVEGKKREFLVGKNIERRHRNSEHQHATMQYFIAVNFWCNKLLQKIESAPVEITFCYELILVWCPISCSLGLVILNYCQIIFPLKGKRAMQNLQNINYQQLLNWDVKETTFARGPSWHYYCLFVIKQWQCQCTDTD